ncbi:DUF4139 domain-containing protein [Brevundimonas sp.]|uniref:DUF4139 domain-containing protein n=1 Tax=Brevundimonas sp. TaxID=1871086 RepID=UPI0035B09C5E
MRVALRAGLIGLALAAAAAAAAAQPVVVSEGPDNSVVVFYRDRPVSTSALLRTVRGGRIDPGLGLGLVVERRTIDIPAGEAVIRLEGLAEGVIAETATIDGLPADVIERNLDYDLLSPGSLLARSVGQPVTVVRTNAETGAETARPAMLRAAPQGVVVEVDGRIEALDCSGLTERIVFDRVPEGLAERPTLTMRTRSERARRAEVTLAYLAGGLMWSADYVARINPDGETLSLTGWLTLANVGGSSFPAAPVQAVAGRFNRDRATRPVQPRPAYIQPACWPQDTTTEGAMIEEIVVTGSRLTAREMMAAGPPPPPPPPPPAPPPPPPLATQSDLGDYKLYTLPEPTSVLPRQTKQVRFLEQPAVRFDRLNRYRINEFNLDPERIDATELLVRARNETDDGLGLALPGGSVAVMETVGGRASLAGEATIQDTPIGLPVELALGQDRRIEIRGRLNSETPNASGLPTRTLDVDFQLRNRTDAPIEVEMIPGAQAWPGFRILETTVASQVADSGLTVFRVTVPADGFASLRYRFEVEG